MYSSLEFMRSLGTRTGFDIFIIQHLGKGKIKETANF